MPRRITHVVIHNNGVAGRTIEDIRRSHTKPRRIVKGKNVGGNGWKAIGYHYVIHEDGTEHIGRSENRVGAHVAEFNGNTIGICVIGNGDKKNFNKAQWKKLTSRCKLLMVKYKLGPEAVIGHRETASLVPPQYATSKTCPGTKIDLDAFRARLGFTVT